MILLTENINPSLLKPNITVLADEAERRKRKLADALVQEDRWVKNLIDGLAGVLRETKH